MRVRTAILGTVVVIFVVSIVNFFSDNFTLLSKLPENHVEQARREALQKPFILREHRLERRPRLESASLRTGEEEIQAERYALGSSHTSQRLKSVNIEVAEEEKRRAKYHVIPSVDGGIYTEWQVRVCYYWYKKMKEQYPDSAMGGFTRLLHSGVADNLMEEIPTVVVSPLPDGVDQGYVVLNRPYAFLQWVRKYMQSIPEDYIFMAEPDHIFVKPPPLWATPTRPATYPFTYIQPEKYAHLISKVNDKDVSIDDMAQIGNSPVQIHKRQLEDVVDRWYNTSLRMMKDADTYKALGWVLEMYAFSISSAQVEGGPLQYDIHPEMMVQPPFDPLLHVKGKPTFMVHLTYGMDYDVSGRMVYGKIGDLWHWDKRDYRDRYPPRNIPKLPPQVNAPAIEYLLAAINEASEHLSWLDSGTSAS